MGISREIGELRDWVVFDVEWCELAIIRPLSGKYIRLFCVRIRNFNFGVAGDYQYFTS